MQANAWHSLRSWFSSRARVVCARDAQFISARMRARIVFLANPFRLFFRRRKCLPAPVKYSERRRRIWRGDNSSLPCKPALSELTSEPIVKAVVRRLAYGNQVPCAPLPAREILNRVNVMHRCCKHIFAEPSSISASELVAPQHCIAQMQPALALVIHANKKRHDLERRSWR